MKHYDSLQSGIRPKSFFGVLQQEAPAFAFLCSWLRNPASVGLPFQSTSWTARRVAQTVLDVADLGAGPILELGAGTGSITRALLEQGCPQDEVVAVERDSELCKSLHRQFPGLHVIRGDALELGSILQKAHLSSISVVLSGLPMRAISPNVAARCYSDAFRLMPPQGAIVQYTYGFRPPVDPRAQKFQASFSGREWRNFPPVGIWSYRAG
jgi:phosphatidylethanolamine/phosphatidyl-N-methylethanolamine N-methyltransferase